MENEKKDPSFKTAEVITLVIITCAVSLLMGVIISRTSKKNYQSVDEEVQEFLKQYNYIVDNYYEEVDKEKLLDAALEGMLGALGDPYSSYLSESQNSTFISKLNGKYKGIGIEIVNDTDNNIIIAKVFENSPAAKAGVKPLDIIKKVNNQDVSNTTAAELIEIIKNTESSFKLEIQREKDIKEITITKEQVTLSSVASEIIERNHKKIGYIYVSIFAMNTDSQFKSQLERLEKNKIDSLIIDLRGNSGGHLSSAENIISMFLNSKKVIYQIEDKSKITKHYSKGKETKKYPIIVLMDNSSASASEMMAAALKENYGATLVGKTTFGKGTVQELKNDNQYKITTKKWLTPKGTWINEIGIKPDIEVELDKKYYANPTNENDTQLQKALEVLTK